MLEQRDFDMISQIITKSNEPILYRLDKVEDSLSSVEHKITDIDKSISALSQKVDISDQRITGLEAKFTVLDQKVSNLDQKVSDLDQKVSDLDQKASDIQLTLENETNRNIKIIAEGHLSLDRKLTDALRTESEKEMLLIRMNSLENQIRRIAGAQAS